MSKVLKKIEPVRLLEAHMACLRQITRRADEPELGSRPTEDEIAEHEVAEKAHRDKVAIAFDTESKCYSLQFLTLLPACDSLHP
jgi:hypothetical protein